MRAYLEATISENADKLEGLSEISESGVISREQWFSLCQICSPGMHRATMNSLFTTMDKDKDGVISHPEMFSDTILGILQKRFNYTKSVHPLEGAYMCLPQPPFEKSPAQEACIAQLIQVWNEVVADWKANGNTPKFLKMVPDTTAKPKAPQPKDAKQSFMSSMFSSKKAAPVKAQVPMKPEPQSVKGLYLVGGTGCGKTILLDMFYRSLPAGFPVVRVHWHEFQRDALRLTARTKRDDNENLFDAAALAIAKNCKLLLLDELWITHINEALNVKELFRALWARGTTIVVTSNYRQQELYDGGINRAAFEHFLPDLAAQCPEFNFASYDSCKNFRTVDVASSNDRYLHPISEETRASMKAKQNELLGEGALVEESFVFQIPGEGRSEVLPVSATAADGSRLCEVEFRQLFSKPLGRAIYSALAIEYEHIFITGAPKFDSTECDEFRRFVTFVDILYGKKGSLYIQAECEVTELFPNPKQGLDDEYQGGVVADDHHAWLRMTGMLQEMRTDKYSIVSWLARNHMTNASASKLVL